MGHFFRKRDTIHGASRSTAGFRTKSVLLRMKSGLRGNLDVQVTGLAHEVLQSFLPSLGEQCARCQTGQPCALPSCCEAQAAPVEDDLEAGPVTHASFVYSHYCVKKISLVWKSPADFCSDPYGQSKTMSTQNPVTGVGGRLVRTFTGLRMP